MKNSDENMKYQEKLVQPSGLEPPTPTMSRRLLYQVQTSRIYLKPA